MASLTNILATVFTLLLFTFLTVTMYDQVDIELFRQYKSPIFIGSMFLFLAILGLPYMQYDVAHQAPVATFVSTAIGIVVIVCALFVFVLNWDVGQCVAAVSTLVIFTTIVGRISGTSDFPAFAGMMLQFVLVGSVLFGTMKGAEWGLGRVADPTVRLVLAYWTQIAPIGLWGMLVYALYRGIRSLVEYRTTVRPCPAPRPVPRFEPFQVQVPAPSQATLPQLLQAAIDRTQDTLDSLVEQTDSTCAIMKEVEQGYVGARSGPEDETEYKLPAEEQASRRQSRQERAMKAFASSRKIFAAARNTTPLECFQDVEVSEYVLEVRELCTKLHGLLENAETLTQIRNVQRMEADLAFAERQLTKAEEAFQDASSTPTPTPTPTPTQIYSVLEGAELEAAAKGLLTKELNLRITVQQLQQKIKAVRARMSKAYTKVNMVATGDYNVTETKLKSTEVNLVNP